jgi:hypothetical protein
VAPKFGLLFLSLLLQFSCSPTKFAIRQSSGVLSDSKVVFTREPDLQLAEYGLAGNLKILEVLQYQDPENVIINLFLAEAYSAYALGFAEDKIEELEFEDPELRDIERIRAISFYMRARSYALQALQQFGDFSDIEEVSPGNFQKKIDDLNKDAVPAIFWTAFSWGSAINLSRDDIDALAQLSKIEIMMSFVKRHDPEFFFGGVYLFEGVFFGSRSPTLGGDLARSRSGFDKAKSLTKGKLLIVYYLQAYSYCLFSQDRECFRSNLNYVLNAPKDIFPEQSLANAVARKKAKRLLEREEEYFLPDDLEEPLDEEDQSE